MGDRLHHSFVSSLYYSCVVMLFLKAQLAAKTEKSCLETECLLPAGGLQTDQVFLFMFSLCFCDLLGSFKQNYGVVLVKELGQFAVFENSLNHFSVSFFFFPPFSNQIR